MTYRKPRTAGFRVFMFVTVDVKTLFSYVFNESLMSTHIGITKTRTLSKRTCFAAKCYKMFFSQTKYMIHKDHFRHSFPNEVFSTDILHKFNFYLFVFPGGTNLPRAYSGRFFIGFWWMYCIVVIATFSGNLIAFLTVSKQTLPFQTLEELVAQDDMKFGTPAGTIYETNFKVAT